VRVVHYGEFARKLGYYIAFDEWAEADVHMRDLVYKCGGTLTAHYAKKPID